MQEHLVEYASSGFTVIRGAANLAAINEFILKREPKNYLFEENKVAHDNFLDGRNEFVNNLMILDVLFPEKVLDFFAEHQKKFVLQLVEARVGTSGIPWHIDSLEPLSEFSPEYIGVHVALERATEDSGRFEIIPNSHRWEIDSNEINNEKCAKHCTECYQYYENLIKINNVKNVFSFDSEAGDVLIWSGRSLHRGVRAKNGLATRRSMFGHLVSVSQDEINNLLRKEKIEKYKSVYLSMW